MKLNALKSIVLILLAAFITPVLCACAEKETIKIGVIAPQTGEYARHGTAFVNAVKLYADAVNSDGGIDGRKLELVIRDDKGDPTEALNYYHLLSKEIKAAAFLGPFTAGAAEVVAEADSEDGFPIVTPAYLESSGASPAFGIGADTGVRAGAVVRYAAKKLGIKRAAVVYMSGDSESEALYADFVSEAITYGVEVAGDYAFEGEDGFGEKLAALIEDERPEAIFLALPPEKLALICAGIRDSDRDVTLLSADSPDPSLECSDGLCFAGYYPAGGEDDFYRAYLQLFGTEPDSSAALGYDCAKILIDAIKAAASDSIEPSQSDEFKAAVRNAVASTDGSFKSGRIYFDAESERSCVILKIEDGEVVLAGKY